MMVEVMRCYDEIRDQAILVMGYWILGRKMIFGRWIDHYLIADIPSYFPDAGVLRLLICLASLRSL